MEIGSTSPISYRGRIKPRVRSFGSDPRLSDNLTIVIAERDDSEREAAKDLVSKYFNSDDRPASPRIHDFSNSYDAGQQVIHRSPGQAAIKSIFGGDYRFGDPVDIVLTDILIPYKLGDDRNLSGLHLVRNSIKNGVPLIGLFYDSRVSDLDVIMPFLKGDPVIHIGGSTIKTSDVANHEPRSRESKDTSPSKNWISLLEETLRSGGYGEEPKEGFISIPCSPLGGR